MPRTPKKPFRAVKPYKRPSPSPAPSVSSSLPPDVQAHFHWGRSYRNVVFSFYAMTRYREARADLLLRIHPVLGKVLRPEGVAAELRTWWSAEPEQAKLLWAKRYREHRDWELQQAEAAESDSGTSPPQSPTFSKRVSEPLTDFLIYCDKQRETMRHSLEALPGRTTRVTDAEVMSHLNGMWLRESPETREKYARLADLAAKENAKKGPGSTEVLLMTDPSDVAGALQLDAPVPPATKPQEYVARETAESFFARLSQDPVLFDIVSAYDLSLLPWNALMPGEELSANAGGWTIDSYLELLSDPDYEHGLRGPETRAVMD
ncbi:hypothetical protein BC835DRAFT_850396 [Cytidiella melzeri]|nr:hypothetical protein BC835DRAFT_850396 [Cytidiella melzeri]